MSSCQMSTAAKRVHSPNGGTLPVLLPLPTIGTAFRVDSTVGERAGVACQKDHISVPEEEKVCCALIPVRMIQCEDR